jgi:hypothetical protein
LASLVLLGLGDKLSQQTDRIENLQARTHASEMSSVIGSGIRQIQQIAVARHKVICPAVGCQIEVRFIVRVTTETNSGRHRIDQRTNVVETIEKDLYELNRKNWEPLLHFRPKQYVAKFRNDSVAEEQLQATSFNLSQKGKRRPARSRCLK